MLIVPQIPVVTVSPTRNERQPKLLDLLCEALRVRLQPANRRDLSPLGQTVCPLSQDAASRGDGRTGNQCLHLAVKEHVSASTQNQALCALLFLDRHVLGREIGELGEVIRARKQNFWVIMMSERL